MSVAAIDSVKKLMLIHPNNDNLSSYLLAHRTDADAEDKDTFLVTKHRLRGHFE